MLQLVFSPLQTSSMKSKRVEIPKTCQPLFWMQDSNSLSSFRCQLSWEWRICISTNRVESKILASSFLTRFEPCATTRTTAITCPCLKLIKILREYIQQGWTREMKTSNILSIGAWSLLWQGIHPTSHNWTAATQTTSLLFLTSRNHSWFRTLALTECKLILTLMWTTTFIARTSVLRWGGRSRWTRCLLVTIPIPGV